MKLVISGIIFLMFMFLPACGEEKSRSETVTISKSDENDETLKTFNKLIWETDMDLAFERAKKEQKNVMIMVEDKRCKWCKNMKVGALSDPTVQEKLQSYILLKVQRSDKETSTRIKEFTGAIPSFYFMEADQELYESIVGFFATEDFLGFLTEIEDD